MVEFLRDLSPMAPVIVTCCMVFSKKEAEVNQTEAME